MLQSNVISQVMDLITLARDKLDLDLTLFEDELRQKGEFPEDVCILILGIIIL